MGDLFTTEKKIEIIKINDFDVIKQTDKLKLFESQIIKHEPNYPEIQRWLKNKVLPGIRSTERTAWIGTCNGEPIASAVVKHGEKSKFCHLHIDDTSRNNNYGDIFFSMMAIEIKRLSKDVYFTLPEGLWAEKGEFFKSFGFNSVSKFSTQYRSFEPELICEIPFETLWQNVLNKLPQLRRQFANHPESPLNGILMSIHPNYADKIMNGEKVIEIRKKFNKKWKGTTATIYSTMPHKELIGYATINEVEENTPEIIWNTYYEKLGCTKSEFDNYVASGTSVYAITLSNIHRYPNPITLSWLKRWMNEELRPPQSYSALKNDESWSNAVSIAQLLHNSFSSFVQVA